MKITAILSVMLLTVQFIIAAVPEASIRETVLARNGKAEAVIVHPAGRRADAEKIRDAVMALCGVELPIKTDTEVTEPRFPRLLPEFRKRNLILLGRFGVNRAVWGIYNRYGCAADGYYPGGSGYEVRSVSDPYRTGADTLIAAGSTTAGDVRAVEVLIGVLKQGRATAGNLAVPWFFKVKLDGYCKSVFDADERNQRRRTFPGNRPNIDNRTCRFYENMLSYWLTGRTFYRDLGIKFLDLIIEEEGKRTPGVIPSYVYHYWTPLLIRAAELFRGSGIYTGEQLKKLEIAVMKTLTIDYASGVEAQWMRSNFFRRRVLEGHHVAAWIAEKMLSDYILDRIPPSRRLPGVTELAQKRRKLQNGLLMDLTSKRWRSYETSGTASSDPILKLQQLALCDDRYEWIVDTGTLKRAADFLLMRTSPDQYDIGSGSVSVASRTGVNWFLGVLASLQKDPTLKHVLDLGYGGWSAAHLWGYHRTHVYRPGEEFPSAPGKPEGTSIGMEPGLYEQTLRNVPLEKAFDYAVLRDGFTAEADWLLVSGGYDFPPNTIVKMYSGKRSVLLHTRCGSPYDQNSVIISRTGVTAGRPKRQLARLDAVTADLIKSTVENYGGMNWTRSIKRLGKGKYQVVDTFTALADGEYSVLISWRANFYDHTTRLRSNMGVRTPGGINGRNWMVCDGKKEFIIAPEGISGYADLAYDEMNNENVPVFRERLTRRFRKGETITVRNLFTIRDASGTQAVSTTSKLERSVSSAADQDFLWRSSGIAGHGVIRTAKRLDGHTWDLGAPVRLAGISGKTGDDFFRGEWFRGLITDGRMPVKSVSAGTGKDSLLPLPGKIKTAASARSSNYGHTTLHKRAWEFFEPEVQKRVRFIRLDGDRAVARRDFRFFSADSSEKGDFSMRVFPDGIIWVYPDFWRSNRSGWFGPHEIMVLSADGREIRRLKFDHGVFFLTVIGKQIFVGSFDRKVRVYNKHGDLKKTVAASGRCAGFPTGAAVGRIKSAGPDGERLALTRYGNISILSASGKPLYDLWVPRPMSIYWITDILPDGVDLNGDGEDETLAMSTYGVIPLSAATQTNKAKSFRLPVAPDSSSGSRTLKFELLRSGGPLVLAAKTNMIGVFDMKSSSWKCVVRPEIAFSAAVRLPSGDLAAADLSGRLIVIELDSNGKHRRILKYTGHSPYRHFAPSEENRVLAAAQDGLFLLDLKTGNRTKLLFGDFRQSALVDGKLLVLDSHGAVTAFKSSVIKSFSRSNSAKRK